MLGTALDKRMVCTYVAAFAEYTPPLVVTVLAGTRPFALFAMVAPPPVAADFPPLALFATLPLPPAAADSALVALFAIVPQSPVAADSAPVAPFAKVPLPPVTAERHPLGPLNPTGSCSGPVHLPSSVHVHVISLADPCVLR